MRSVIVNADDFGLLPEINEAVARGHDAGTITSATLMPNGDAVQQAAQLALERGLGVGLHFTLTFGEPVGGRARSLVTDEGRFCSRRVLLHRSAFGAIKLADVMAELEAQWSRLHQLGITPTHLDGHQHVQLIPVINAAITRFAVAKGIRVRVPFVNWRAVTRGYRLGQRAALAALCRRAVGLGMPRLTHRFTSAFDLAQPASVDAEHYVHLVRSGRRGTVELMVHPSLPAAQLAKIHPEIYAVALAEGRVLEDPETARLFEKRLIRPVSVLSLIDDE